MRRPLDLEVIAVVERKVRSLVRQLVEDHPVVDAHHRRAVRSKQLAATLDQVRWIDRVDVEQQLGRREIDVRFLAKRIEIQEDDLARIVITDDGLAGQSEERTSVQPRVPARPFEVQSVHRPHGVAPDIALNHLQAGQRGKRLQFDELWNEDAVLADDCEIDLREAGESIHPRRVPALRDGPLHLPDAILIGNLSNDRFRGLDDPFFEIVGQEERTLRQPEAEPAAQTPLQFVGIPLVSLRRDLRVEQSAKARIHGAFRPCERRRRSALRPLAPPGAAAARSVCSERSADSRIPPRRKTDLSSSRLVRGTTLR